MLIPKTILQETFVDRPPKSHHKISPWVDEQLWGHRIWTQSPWLIFLEFLTVADSASREGKLFNEDKFYPLVFRPKKRMYLRNILWNNETIKIIQETIGDNNSAWDKWMEAMQDKAQGAKLFDFSYLRKKFRSFDDFASLVLMIQRDAAVEGEANKRWSSRFIFPFGPNAIYEDLNIKNGNTSREYINFGRTGELLYQMICRSKYVKELRPYLESFLKGDNKWNKLLGIIQPEEEEAGDERGYSYLPYKSHDSFDELGKDWLNIFELNLPGFDALEHLTTFGALHIMLYQLQVSRQWIGDNAKSLYFICEVVTPKRNVIRQQSVFNFQENSVLTTKAVEAYITLIENSEQWNKALNDSSSDEETFLRCKGILQEEFWWGDDADFNHERNPKMLLSTLRELAIKDHRQVSATIHRIYGRNIGLVSRRGTNKFRYAPSDSLLKSLLFANVKKRMELHQFLNLLYKRYFLIFGPNEAEVALPSEDFDKQLFKANATRLEQRLTSLGLLKRLSDGCAYVINPYGLK